MKEVTRENIVRFAGRVVGRIVRRVAAKVVEKGVVRSGRSC